MSLISSREQSSTYQFMPDVNPLWSRIQRVQATISPDGLRINFGALRPIPRALLCAKAYIKWTYEIRRQELGVDQFFVTFNQAAMFMKPYSILGNSTTKSKLSLNGYGITNYNSRYWNQYLARMFATEEQLGGYFSTSGGGFLALNKENGELVLHRPAEMVKVNVENKIKDIRDAVLLNSPPERCYAPVPEGKKGNLRLPRECGYCPHKYECYADANNGYGIRTFIYANGPKYLIRVAAIPKVMEA